ncbi:MAG: phosphoribosylformylglycinamidine synthase subunit PurL [Actinobacteria bacterium]|nr:phosphoribosylformylglycinamidine synthase subunit PurL [Actinomycetota bacterium]
MAITISSRLLGRLFIDVLGCGHRAREKRIPSALIESEDLRADVLSGIFRGDGSVSFPRNGSPVRVSHSTTSATLHEQLLLLLQDLGIFPTRYERRAGATIQGREVASRKAYALEFYGHDAIVRASDWFAHPLRDRMRSAVAPTKGSAFSRPRAKPEGAVATVAIQAIDELDVEVPVYDFEVPGTHLFVTTGGIVTHNCVGVPTVGGDTFFDAAYDANPLVNAMCVGIVPSERLTRARASGPGNLIFLYGATTGRDGIGGASVLASQELSDENDDKRPTVQIGDPFTGKKLIEASLELVERRVVESLQDLGAAGLASSLAEMAGRGETGVDVHLDRVPLREADLDPVEIMTSESQERMVAVVAPDRVSEAEAICRRWELECAVVGEVTESGELRTFVEGELVGAVPASFLTEEAPRYRVRTTPRPLEEPIAHRAITAEREELLDLLHSPNVRSRASIYERYDHLVGSRTVRRPGLDAAVLRLRPSLRGLAVSLDAAGRLAYLDPRAGGALAVFEAARNVACAGGRPLAITNCLNFGNPEKPEIAWELTEAIEGMARACEAIGIPVVSGNVSLYNETDGRAILPTPAVGCVGVVEDVRAIPRAWREGDVVLVAGSPDLALDGSEYQAQFLGGAAGRPPQLDFVAEAALIRFLWSSSALLTSAHDAAEGGLAVTLAEAALAAGIGAEVEIGSDAVEWFGEGGGQAVVTCRRQDAARLGSIPLREIGVVGGARLLGVGLDELRAAHEGRRL